MRILLSLLLSFGFLVLPVAFKKWTHGFRLEKITFELPYQEGWEVQITPEQKESVDAILAQPFSYLNRGAQAYVFASKDGQTVLKLFRLNRKRLFLKKRKNPASIRAFPKFLNAAKTAFEFAQEQTGLLYVHLNKTSQGLPLVEITDRIGRSFTLDLNNYRFALQKRAEPFEKLLGARNSPTEMERLLDQVLIHLYERVSKKIVNSDPTLDRNWGFLTDRAIEIDFGNFEWHHELSDPDLQIREMHRYAKRMRRWLEKNAPEWVGPFDEKFSKIKKERF